MTHSNNDDPGQAGTEHEAPIAVLLKQARVEAGLTQEQWASRLGVSTRTVARWELEEKEPRSAAQKAGVAQGLAGLGTPAAMAAMTLLLPLPVPAAYHLAREFVRGRAVRHDQAQAIHGGQTKSLQRRQLEVVVDVEDAAARLGVPLPAFTAELVLVVDRALERGFTLEDLRPILEGR